MGTLFSDIGDFFAYLFNQLSTMRIVDFIDIALVSILFFYVFIFIRERRAGKLAVGVLLLLLAVMVSELANMRSLSFILSNIVQVGMVALIVIFQPELRSMLEKMGGNSVKGISRLSESRDDAKKTELIDELCEACQSLSDSRTGALIAIEGGTKLGDEIRSGVIVNADVSRYLIGNIFFNKAPLHDGAMIIRDGRVHACGCFLPLSENHEIIKELGTRHRAAIGLSEVSDAFVIVVSEETGMISVARNGRLSRNFDKYSLREQLKQLYELDVKKTKNPVKKIQGKMAQKNPDKQKRSGKGDADGDK
ncbi:MAG: diadenylate cyclase CdaA [Clostridia bacterium]|nr:diadenylate cyclase CdaA [Clostridia bacterium]